MRGGRLATGGRDTNAPSAAKTTRAETIAVLLRRQGSGMCVMVRCRRGTPVARAPPLCIVSVLRSSRRPLPCYPILLAHTNRHTRPHPALLVQRTTLVSALHSVLRRLEPRT